MRRVPSKGIGACSTMQLPKRRVVVVADSLHATAHGIGFEGRYGPPTIRRCLAHGLSAAPSPISWRSSAAWSSSTVAARSMPAAPVRLRYLATAPSEIDRLRAMRRGRAPVLECGYVLDHADIHALLRHRSRPRPSARVLKRREAMPSGWFTRNVSTTSAPTVEAG